MTRRKIRDSNPRDMESDMDLLSELLEVGKVASRTEVNPTDSTTRVSDDVVLMEIPDERYGKPPADKEVWETAS